jgi:ubiquinone/menaquinone biosynthesis C-methylase UbiE
LPAFGDLERSLVSRVTDRRYLRSCQYRDASKLNARIQLHRRFSTNPQGWVSWLIEHLHLGDHRRVLDVGCGPGSLWQDPRAKLAPEGRVTLLDLSEGMLAQARECLSARRDRCSFVQGDAQALPFAGGSFDAVFAGHCLYHIPDRGRALAEIHRVLEPGGRLYASTNGHNHMRELREWMAAFDPDIDQIDVADAFGLENGADQLAAFFDDVTLYRYPDALVVTDIEPLVDYALSMSAPGMTHTNAQVFRILLDREMKLEGAIYIHKESGLFCARRGTG